MTHRFASRTTCHVFLSSAEAQKGRAYRGALSVNRLISVLETILPFPFYMFWGPICRTKMNTHIHTHRLMFVACALSISETRERLQPDKDCACFVALVERRSNPKKLSCVYFVRPFFRCALWGGVSVWLKENRWVVWCGA